jgi:membrane protein
MKRFLSHDIWVKMSLVGSRKIYFIQILYLSALRFIRVRCMMCASSLTTVTMISIVPVLAILFSIAKGFGGYQKLHTEVIVPGIEQWFGASEAPELRKAIDYLLFFVEETDMSNLGLVGLITISYALIRLLGSVESIFNDLWRIESNRPFVRKISDYLTVAVVVPIVLFCTASLSAAAKSNHLSMYLTEQISWWGGGSFFLELLTFPILWATFSFAYYFLPNTRVQVGGAITGGIVGGSLCMVFHHVHVILQLGVANYNALYSGFSAFPIFMIWVFFSWVAVLVGASCSAAIQTRENHRDYVIRENLSVRDREWIAFRICFELTKSFLEGTPCKDKEILEERVQESSVAIRTVLHDLRRVELIEETKEGGAVLIRSPKHISIFQVLDSVKGVALPVEGVSSTKELRDAKTDLLKRLRNQKEVVLTEEDSIWMDSASLHLQEKGLIDVRENKKITASKRLLMHDQLQKVQIKVEEATTEYSLLVLYETLMAHTSPNHNKEKA